MGKWDVDTSDYDDSRDSGGYDGDEPKKGIYDGRLVSLAEHESSAGNEGLEWVFEITEEPYKGWRGWTYSNMDSTMWKTEQIVNAIQGGKKGKMALKPAEGGKGAESATVKKAKPVRLRVTRETYEGEPKARLRTILPKVEGKKADEDFEDDPFGED